MSNYDLESAYMPLSYRNFSLVARFRILFP